MGYAYEKRLGIGRLWNGWTPPERFVQERLQFTWKRVADRLVDILQEFGIWKT